MLITQVDDQAIHDPKQFWAAVAKKRGPVQLHTPDRDAASADAIRTVPPERRS
jgi:hypothetical protein